MKPTTMIFFLNVAVMIFTSWLIYYFNSGWWIILFIICYFEKYEIKDTGGDENETKNQM